MRDRANDLRLVASPIQNHNVGVRAPTVERFLQSQDDNSPPPAAKDIAHTLRHVPSKNVSLDLICGDFALIKYSLIDQPSQLNAALNYFRGFIAKARTEYDLIVIDCNPSSSFITRCGLSVAQFILSPVRADKYSILGVEILEELIGVLGLNPKPTQIILMNDVPRNRPPDPVELDLRAHQKFGSRVLLNRVVRSKLLKADPSYTGFATDRPVPWRQLLGVEIGKLSDELIKKLGI